MIAALAQQPQTTNVAWWVPFLIPLGALLAAIVTGSMTWQSNRKKPHEKLQHLVEVLNDWPKVGDEDLPGKNTVQIAIALTLGEMRRKDKLKVLDTPREWATLTEPEHVDFYEHLVDLEVARRAKGSMLAEFAFNAVLLAGGTGAIMFLMWSNSALQWVREHPVPAAAALTVLIVALSAWRTALFDSAWIPKRLKEEMRERGRQWILEKSPWRDDFDSEGRYRPGHEKSGQTHDRGEGGGE
ncbi:hypothetical protein [Nocardia testacea]|uniref:hypothetical protein n=1 Tax=Nocardia testacea TaxID=248551 RepID=UPI0005851232|nr:hypothetical protein [Nocardia testacea]